MKNPKYFQLLRENLQSSLPEVDHKAWKEKSVRSRCRHMMAQSSFLVSKQEAEYIEDQIAFHFCGFGPFEHWLRDPAVTEILVNGYRDVFIEKNGCLESVESPFESNGQILSLLQKRVGECGKCLDLQHPMVDVRLPEGERLNAIIEPLSLQGPVVSIRKPAQQDWTLSCLVENKTLSPGLKKLLEQCIKDRLNMVIAGGTGSGKTTTLNACANTIPQQERIISIEDTVEIKLIHTHHIALETRAANAEGQGAVGIRELLKNTLRMRPDRILVGEVRGGEVLDMFQAMNTGHKGSVTTVHANSSLEALMRLENMALLAPESLPIEAIRPQAIQAIDIIIHQERGTDGVRRILSIDQVCKDVNHYELKNLYSHEA